MLELGGRGGGLSSSIRSYPEGWAEGGIISIQSSLIDPGQAPQKDNKDVLN